MPSARTNPAWTKPLVLFALLMQSLGLPWPGDAAAAGLQDLAAVRRAAEAAVAGAGAADGARVQVAADPLDSRLRLPACAQPLEAEAGPTRSSGRVTVQVRCPSSQPWRLHVPVRVTITRTVVVAARSLAKDEVLAPGDVGLAERDVNGLPYGYLADPARAVGQRLRRGVAAGDVLTPGQVADPVLIRPGQPVTLEARGGGLRVQAPGIARAQGTAGELIPVQNLSSGRVVRGLVVSSSTVEIRLD